uniref:Uncharacterized protein n=1 Tax=Oryza sativa subsp. japonica TaxID=39947 RepID=Q6H4X2_ORYSJ|nr:hypothetical protein [Oryza sativa Japonica Group]BAD26227.1 hypothetical protein [Oryza sativa Japonica Group]
MAAPPRASSPVRACTRGCAHGRRVAPRRCLFAPPPSVAGVNDGRRREEVPAIVVVVALLDVGGGGYGGRDGDGAAPQWWS